MEQWRDKSLEQRMGQADRNGTREGGGNSISEGGMQSEAQSVREVGGGGGWGWGQRVKEGERDGRAGGVHSGWNVSNL